MSRNLEDAISHFALQTEQAKILVRELARAEAEGIDITRFTEGQANLRAKYTHDQPSVTPEQAELREHAYEQRRRAKQARQTAKARGAEPSSRIHPDELLKRSNGCCYLCGIPITDYYEIEHIIPLSRGGEHVDSNLAISCRECNSDKASRIIAFDIATRRPHYVRQP